MLNAYIIWIPTLIPLLVDLTGVELFNLFIEESEKSSSSEKSFFILLFFFFSELYFILFYCLIKYLLDYTSQIKIKKNYLDPLKKLPSILFRSLTRWQIQIIRILCIIISINI